jgi:uncharacterized integral membrane protein (TIGR00698 family)
LENSLHSGRKTTQVRWHEDWVAVATGFLMILGSLVWFVIPIPVYQWSAFRELFQNVLAVDNFTSIGLQFIYFYTMVVLGSILMGRSVQGSLLMFPVVYVLTVVALIIAGNGVMRSLNLEAVIFSLFIGLIIGNTLSLPAWFREALSTELFVKTGLVLLGAGVIFSDILTAGTLGLIQSLVVVISVWYFAYWLCKKFKLDGEFTVMIASAVSICGVSAAIATAGAIKGDTKKLSYVISLVLIVAIPMMIVMPALANYFNFSQDVTGAWLGGTIDTTGAVVASGTLVGETALKISTIVKFSQNVLLGIAAFAISVYWTYTKKDPNGAIEKPGFRLIWERFPKFVLGFIAASLLFSFVIDQAAVGVVKESLKNIQTLWFVLAFTSIGLETKFSDLFNQDNKRPLYAFLIAQFFNIIVTLIVAYILFG